MLNSLIYAGDTYHPLLSWLGALTRPRISESVKPREVKDIVHSVKRTSRGWKYDIAVQFISSM